MKRFDCLKMKDEIQAKVYEKTKDMTFHELHAYLEKSLENDAFWHGLVSYNNAQRQNMILANAST